MQIYGAICIIMAYVGNLHEDQGVTLDFFYNSIGEQFRYMFRGLFQSIFIMAEAGNL